MEQIPEIKRADIFLLVDVIFNEERFKQIVYDESKIFHHEEYYVDYMKRKIIEMKKIKEYKEKSNEGRKFKSSKGIIEVYLMIFELFRMTRKGSRLYWGKEVLLIKRKFGWYRILIRITYSI